MSPPCAHAAVLPPAGPRCELAAAACRDRLRSHRYTKMKPPKRGARRQRLPTVERDEESNDVELQHPSSPTSEASAAAAQGTPAVSRGMVAREYWPHTMSAAALLALFVLGAYNSVEGDGPFSNEPPTRASQAPALLPMPSASPP